METRHARHGACCEDGHDRKSRGKPEGRAETIPETGANGLNNRAGTVARETDSPSTGRSRREHATAHEAIPLRHMHPGAWLFRDSYTLRPRVLRAVLTQLVHPGEKSVSPVSHRLARLGAITSPLTATQIECHTRATGGSASESKTAKMRAGVHNFNKHACAQH